MEKINYSDFIDALVCENKDGIIYATIELTNACNFRCMHCYLGSKKNVRFINKQRLFSLLGELKDMGCISLIITGGEPLLHPDFKEIYTYAKNKGFLITLFTNGSLLNDDIVSVLKENKPTMVEISLYGIDDSSYLNLTGACVNFENIVKNIKKLQNSNIRVRLKTVLLKQTKDNLTKMKELAYTLNVDFRWDYYVINSINDNNDIISKTILTKEDILSFILKDKQKYNLFKNTLFSSFDENDYLYKCGAGKDSIYIDRDFFLSICVIAREPHYDLKKGNLVDGIEFIRKYGKQKMPEHSPCRKCQNINICRYCPSKNKLANDDYCIPIKKYCDIAEKMRNIIINERNIKCLNIEKKLYLKYEKNMFNIIRDNMISIIDTHNSIEEDYLNWKTSMDKEFSNTNKIGYLAFDNERLVGYILYKKMSDGIKIDEIQVIKDHQGDKVTYIKLLKTINNLNLKNSDIIYGYVNKNNIKSQKMCEKLSFKIYDKTDNGIRCKTNYKDFYQILSSYVVE